MRSDASKFWHIRFSDLCVSGGNHVNFSLDEKIGIYVDGSAPVNIVSANNPAGWGVVVVENPTENHDGGKILAC